jgi:DNA (cytosine-5)-methyltransferase 1
MRQRLQNWGGYWILENVPGAPMQQGVMLCGTMFHLQVLRHRYFESSLLLFAPALCQHQGNVKRRGKKTGQYITVAGHDFHVQAARRAMQIDWMNQRELAQAIPPAYTEWIGKQIMEVLQ